VTALTGQIITETRVESMFQRVTEGLDTLDTQTGDFSYLIIGISLADHVAGDLNKTLFDALLDALLDKPGAIHLKDIFRFR